ncbi:MAG: hypothetical protein KKA73_03020, partial [Chloroflexi bacterium]|nr:hypothetical protein [Chloroflexota bacterium]
ASLGLVPCPTRAGVSWTGPLPYPGRRLLDWSPALPRPASLGLAPGPVSRRGAGGRSGTAPRWPGPRVVSPGLG